MEIRQLSEMNIGTLEVAQERLIKSLVNSGFQLNNIFSINQGRYSIITGVENGLPKNILLMFKRDFFHNFGLEFRHLGKTGIGETVNCEDLKCALRLGVTDIYTVYPWGVCYSIKLMDFLEKSVRWINKELKEVRSISVHELKREHDLTI